MKRIIVSHWVTWTLSDFIKMYSSIINKYNIAKINYILKGGKKQKHNMIHYNNLFYPNNGLIFTYYSHLFLGSLVEMFK